MSDAPRPVRSAADLYLAFFGLRERPFKLTANPRGLLLTSGHAEALAAIEYGIASRIGIMLLVGEAGTGKTTVMRAALAAQPGDSRFVTITNPILSRDEFFQELRQGLGLPAAAAASKASFLAELTAGLQDGLAHGKPACLVVDEAHTAPFDLLEEVRLLSNLEASDEKLLPVVLIGQPELADRLNQPELRQLKQRVAVRASLAPLEPRDTAAYVAARLENAGAQPASIFSPEAIELIHSGARGVPRSINVICDNALVAAFAIGERPVSVDTVLEVCADLDLGVPASLTGQPGACQAIPVREPHLHMAKGLHRHEPVR